MPILNYVVGSGAKEAIASSLAVVGLTSLFGAIGHWRAGNVNMRVALIFDAVAIVGSLGATYLVRYVPQGALKKVFAVFLVVMGIFILYQNWGVIPFL